MTHAPVREELVPPSFFTITQSALGCPLQFEPPLNSKELDNLINTYVPGPSTLKQKRAQITLEFLNSIDALCYQHPISLRYYVPQKVVQPPPFRPSPTSSPVAQSRSRYDSTKIQSPSISGHSVSLKRPLQDPSPSSSSRAKRVPGFSIMTRDGIDITDHASRGPKTKEQREHAALMRKLKACGPCKRSKQRCDPSHHRPTSTSLTTPSASTPSIKSAKCSSRSCAAKSRGSISPPSSLGESFSQSPPIMITTSHTGECFSSLPTSLSPADLTLPDDLLQGIELGALPMQDWDPKFFQQADMELDSWNAGAALGRSHNNQAQFNNYGHTFAPLHDPAEAIGMPYDCSSAESSPAESFRHVSPNGHDGVPPQCHMSSGPQPPQALHDEEFDIDQWLDTSTHLVGHKDVQKSQAMAEPLEPMNVYGTSHRPDYDYILYPETPDYGLDIETHDISRNMGTTDRLLYDDLRNRPVTPSSRFARQEYQQSSGLPASSLSCLLPSMAEGTKPADLGSLNYTAVTPRSASTIRRVADTMHGIFFDGSHAGLLTHQTDQEEQFSARGCEDGPCHHKSDDCPFHNKKSKSGISSEPVPGAIKEMPEIANFERGLASYFNYMRQKSRYNALIINRKFDQVPRTCQEIPASPLQASEININASSEDGWYIPALFCDGMNRRHSLIDQWKCCNCGLHDTRPVRTQDADCEGMIGSVGRVPQNELQAPHSGLPVEDLNFRDHTVFRADEDCLDEQFHTSTRKQRIRSEPTMNSGGERTYLEYLIEGERSHRRMTTFMKTFLAIAVSLLTTISIMLACLDSGRTLTLDAFSNQQVDCDWYWGKSLAYEEHDICLLHMDGLRLIDDKAHTSPVGRGTSVPEPMDVCTINGMQSFIDNITGPIVTREAEPFNFEGSVKSKIQGQERNPPDQQYLVYEAEEIEVPYILPLFDSQLELTSSELTDSTFPSISRVNGKRSVGYQNLPSPGIGLEHGHICYQPSVASSLAFSEDQGQQIVPVLPESETIMSFSFDEFPESSVDQLQGFVLQDTPEPSTEGSSSSKYAKPSQSYRSPGGHRHLATSTSATNYMATATAKPMASSTLLPIRLQRNFQTRPRHSSSLNLLCRFQRATKRSFLPKHFILGTKQVGFS